MFAPLGIPPQLPASEKIQDRKHKGGSKRRAVYVNTITQRGLANYSSTEDGNESRGSQPLLSSWMKLVGMKYGVGFCTGQCLCCAMRWGPRKAEGWQMHREGGLLRLAVISGLGGEW